MKINDPVRCPQHYTWLPGIECKEIVRHFSFNLGSAIKYIWRAGRKGDKEGTKRTKENKIKDLEKAIESIHNEIRFEKEKL